MKHSVFLGGIFVLVGTMPAYAYIDPISATFIIQAIVGGFAAAVVAIKRVRVKILSLFGVSSAETEDTTTSKDKSE